ncbi:HemK family protein methyltransferase [Streptomyces sp. NPDC101234]|uniref:HemK family protein methyltransferase n=1 Tax=Streptomyces sp. NPDC101234 TaxID=3366138 RepID=UPI00381CD371
MSLPSTQVTADFEEFSGRDSTDLSASDADAPGSRYENAILAIWQEVLGRFDVDVTDDFLTLGDHSLAPAVVARIRKRLGVDIPVMDFFESRTVTSLAARVAAKEAAARAAAAPPRTITPRPPDAEPVLSYDQQRLWMENQLLPGVIYNVHMRRRLIGPLDVPVLQRSVRAILARHEALRARFPTVEGRPVHRVADPDDDWSVRVEDLTTADGDRTARALALLDEESTTPFDLAEGPLLRCMLVRMSDTEHLLGVTMHHIVSDTWSLALFVRELSALYEAGGDPVLADLPPLPVQYGDYALWQRERLVGEALERQVGYWREHLAGAPPVLALPTAQRRTTTQRAEADRMESVLTREETTALHALCRAQGVTPFMALLAGLTTVFSRWTGQDDVVIGVPLAGRTTSGTDHMIGFFVNVLPFRIDLSGNPSFTELLGRVRRIALDGYDHADAPLDALVEDLQVARDPRRTPLFEVVLNVVGSPEAERAMGLTVEPMETPSLFSRFDLTVTAQESDGRLRLQLDFASDRCDVEMVRVLVGHVHELLSGAVADPGRGILDYTFRPPAALPGPQTPALDLAPHEEVDRHAASAAGTAVTDADGEWSYGRLARTASDIAGLLAGHGIAAGDRVAVVRRPGAGFVAALLGCAKAGADCSVIDDPAAATAVSAVLDAAADGTGTIGLSEVLSNPAATPTGQAPAPSGTQDRPADRFGATPADRIAVLSSVPGHLESALAMTFRAGATFAIPNCSFAADAGTVTHWLRTNAISVLYATPSVLRALAADPTGPRLPDLTRVFVENTGDLLSRDVDTLRRLAPTARFVSLYGSGADGRPRAVHEVPVGQELRTAPLRVPLGRELPGAPAELVRPGGRPAAVGEPGELTFATVRTGDIGRRWPDGSLEFVCRADGSPAFDPQETAATLWDIPEVRDALVTVAAGPADPPALTAYVAGPDPRTDAAVLHNFLRTRLPGYLLPERIVVLPALPRTPWGEYDLAALEASAGDGGTDEEYVPPRTPMEEQLTELIKELLDIRRVGVYDSFFELGGFSLLATQLATRIRALFHVELALRDIFEAPTVDELAQLIVRTQAELSGDDDLEALLAELDTADQDGTAAALPVAPGEDAVPLLYGRVEERLREQAVFTADKPDESPQSTARALWFAAAGTPRAVTADATEPLPGLTPEQERALDELLGRRIAGEPLAYLTGRGGFLGLELLTAPGALIPRRGTELLAGAALDLAGEIADRAAEVRILDLCTGAGNLAVSLAVLEPRARVWASDLEADAVAVAARNAEFHEVADRVTAAAGDLFAALDELPDRPAEFDLIVCNPPYMPTESARTMPVEVGGFEPAAAFDGGDVGLTVVYRLIAEAHRHLVPGGWLGFEVGAGMGRVVEKRLAALGTYSEIRLVADQDGNTRAILARRLS